MRLIEVEHISKSFQIHAHKQKRLRDYLSHLFSNLFTKDTSIEVLKDISFTADSGEMIGIIGINGSGKSTLLKIFAQITPPSSGIIRLYGKVASLIEVGSGFNKELSGRENIFLNGTILGMSRQQIKNCFHQIIEFSGIDNKLIDTPIKKYSSGMKIRLAFALAVHLDAEILLMDEVLSVSDTNFQEKGMQKLKQLQQQGKTILFVSHDMSLIKQHCDRVLVLQQGKITFDGTTRKGVGYYLHQNQTTSTVTPNTFRDHILTIQNVQVTNQDQQLLILKNEAINFSFDLVIHKDNLQAKDYLQLTLMICEPTSNQQITSLNYTIDLAAAPNKEKYGMVCTIPKPSLMEGDYRVHVQYKTKQYNKTIHSIAMLHIQGISAYDKSNNLISVNYQWQIT